MDQTTLAPRLAVALAIGLLIGLERGWVQRDEAEGERTLGLRTLGLTGLLGGATGAIAAAAPGVGAPLLAVALAVYGLIIGVMRYREMLREATLGATTIVAALLTFVLGAMAVLVDPTLAAAAAVAVTGLLALKQALHGWLQRLTWIELRAALLLLTMTLILLPILPNRDMGPMQALNPHELWLMTILIAAVQAAGYVAIKIAGERSGVLLSAVAGGLVSSTAVTLGLARAVPANPNRVDLFAAGIQAAGATMLLRVLVIAALLNAELAVLLALPLGLAALVQGGAGALLQRRDMTAAATPDIELGSPFELPTVLKFGAVLVVVMLISKAAAAWAGGAGVVAVAALSGVADVDAISLSMLRLAGTDLTPLTAAAAILASVATNTLAKAIYSWWIGGRALGLRNLTIALAAIGAAALGLALIAWGLVPLPELGRPA